nr:hypothetical protein TetV2_00294 [Oceanusvirus sp.]
MSTVSAVRERLVFGFNTFYSDFLAVLAKNDDAIKKRLKKHYRVINRKSDEYMIAFHKSCAETEAFSTIFDDEANPEGCSSGDLLVARGLKYRDLPSSISRVVLAHVRTLSALAWIFGELCDAAESGESGEATEEGEAAVQAVNELFERFMESIAAVQMGKSWGAALDGMVDDEARAVFRSTLTSFTALQRGGELEDEDDDDEGRGRSRTEGEGEGEDEGITEHDKETMINAFDMMKCSKLGSIVQEISESIDKEKLKKAVEAGVGTQGGIDPSNMNMDMMGDLFRQVSGAITSKLQSGEISNEDLVSETMTLMNSVKGMM